jgi:choice-of-anchor B domain-containing protein
MRVPLPRRSLGAAALLTLSLGAVAHEDDPKVLDRVPPVKSPAYRTADWGRGAGLALGSAIEPFDAQNATLLAWLPLGEFGTPFNGNVVEGYVSASGREYALFGNSNGTHVVEVTHPSDPVIAAFIAGPDSLWRDVRVRGKQAYAVSEGGSGIQVINLTNIDAGQATLVNVILTGGNFATHTVYIDDLSGFLYRCGGGVSNVGLRMYNLSNPIAPSYVGAWPDRYVHETLVKTFTSGPYAGKQIAFCCGGFNQGFSSPGVSIVDVTNKSNPVHIGQVTWPGAAFSHQCWLSQDDQLLYINDELDEDGLKPTTTYVVDVSNLSAPTYVTSFTNGNQSVGHNLYVKGDTLFASNYRSGLRVYDLAANPLAPPEIAYFDTDPTGDGANFHGLWDNYPYLPSGIVLGSDIERGLFVLWVGTPKVDIEVVGGAPEVLDPAGHQMLVDLAELTPGIYAQGTGQLHYDAGAGPVSVPLVPQGGGTYGASLPAFPCGTEVTYYLSAESTDGLTWIDPPNGYVHTATVTTGAPQVFADAFEADGGWTVGAPGDTATTEGRWVRVDPVGTTAQPEHDHSEPGADCFVTGQATPESAFGDNDVDGGATTLLSPVLDLSGAVDPRVSYWRWYSNSKGINPHNDTFTVDVSDDGGSSWTNVETVGPDEPGVDGTWIHHEFHVTDFVAVTAAVRVRFVAADFSAESNVEAAVDDFTVTSIDCPDCNANGASDALEVAGGTVLDLDQEGTPDECQPLSADAGQLSIAAGGTAHFDLQGGTPGELYFLLGSLSGPTPGFDVGAVHIPLVPDIYFNYSVSHPNTPPLLGSFGVLDAAGAGAAQFALAPGFTSLVGLEAHHAWVGINPLTIQLTMASNALPLAFVP